MVPRILLSLCVSLVLGINSAQASDTGASELEAMFAWWNGAMASKEGPTAAGFRQYFTEDGAIIINGQERVRGIDALVKHFQRIKQKTEFIEVKVPFDKEFRDGNNIFTSHEINAVRGGRSTRDIAMGYAVVRDGKLAVVSLVRHTLP